VEVKVALGLLLLIEMLIYPLMTDSKALLTHKPAGYLLWAPVLLYQFPVRFLNSELYLVRTFGYGLFIRLFGPVSTFSLVALKLSADGEFVNSNRYCSLAV
jgi:hypothetical protein